MATSSAVGALWNWVWAMVSYTEKAKIVKPRQRQVIVMQGKLAVARADLLKAKDDLMEVDKQLQNLSD